MTDDMRVSQDPQVTEGITAALGADMNGTVLEPGTPEYDAARQLWNSIYDKRPAVIAQCTTTGDVVSAVNFARRHGLPLSVRAGGHSAAGHSLVDGGLAIDLSQMNQVRVDQGNRVASVQGGATWKAFDEATHAYGLATTGGVISSVGVSGLTLGGGFGYLMRSCGMACDNLIGAEVVTASGDVIRVDDSRHSDLLWGLKGGGGNFGVVTSLDLRLHPVHNVYGGMVAHPLDDATELLRRYRDFMSEAPDELAVFVAMITTPDGMPLIGLLICYSGDPEHGESVVKPLLDWGSPAMANVGPMPYPQLQQMLDEPNPPGLFRHWKGDLVDELSDPLIDNLVNCYREVPSPLGTILIESLGGVAGRVASDATAFPHRDASFSLVVSGAWADAGVANESIAWVERTSSTLQPYASGIYVNYIGADEDGRILDAYGLDNYARLANLKSKYDPDNLFRINQNIPPGTTG